MRRIAIKGSSFSAGKLDIRPGFWRWLSAVSLGVLLGLWLCGGDREIEAREGRIYHKVPLAQLADTRFTHVRVCGLVTLVKVEADHDIHVRLSDAARFVVAEIIPDMPLPAPRKGQRICVDGISRYDKAHGWYEIHPVSAWTVQR